MLFGKVFCFSFLVERCVCIITSAYELLLFRLSLPFLHQFSTANSWECQGTSSRLGRKIAITKQSMDSPPSSMATAKFGGIQNRIWVFRSLGRRCSRMSPYNGRGCFVEDWSVGNLFRLLVRTVLQKSIVNRLGFFLVLYPADTMRYA